MRGVPRLRAAIDARALGVDRNAQHVRRAPHDALEIGDRVVVEMVRRCPNRSRSGAVSMPARVVAPTA